MKKTSVGHGTIYMGISSLIFVVSAYLINILLGRYLGPSSYGIYGVIISLITIINLTQTFGLPQAVSKFIAEDEVKSDMILKSGLMIQLSSTILASLVFLLFAVQIAKLLKDTSLVPYIQLSAAVFPLYGIYSLYLNFYNGLHYFKIQALMNIVYSTAKFVSVIGLVFFFHVYGAIAGFIVSPFLALIFWFHFPKTKGHFSYKKIIVFSLPMIGVAIFSNLLQSVDLLFVKALLQSNVNTGLYTATQNISKIPFYGITALAMVLFPSISKSVSQSLPEKTKNLISRSLRFSLLITMPSVLLISATSVQIIKLFYSSAYQSGAESLSILVIGMGFATVLTLLITIISASGFPNTAFWLCAIGVLITAVLCVFLIPFLKLNGAALATTIAAFIIMIAAGIIVYRKFKIFFSFASIIKIFSASFFIFFIAKMLILPILFLPFLYIFLFLIYIFLLFLLKEITNDDIQLVRSLLPVGIMKKIKL